MIPNANEAATVTSTLTGERGQFTVDENSLTHIMTVLTNLYKDPEAAVVREYLTNARDSHIDAGTTRPVEVTTPSHFNKAYIIKDYGIGMSVDDLKNTYSKYGASTKRASNSVVGMLGLGSKSALTYTNTFTITAIKNGVQAKAIISVNEDGVPEFQIVDTRATTEPNGVEIRIPVKDRNSFAEKTNEFLKFWADGLVLVDGREPVKHGLKKIKDTTVKVGGVDHNCEIFLIENVSSWRSDWTGSKVVMGNVSYDVDGEYVNDSLRNAGMGFVAYVPIGSVAVVPSREGLHYTTATKAVLKTVSENLMQHIVAVKRKSFEDAIDAAEAWRQWAGMANHFRSHPGMKGASYKGLVFKDYISHRHTSVEWNYMGHGSTSDGAYLYLSKLLNNGPAKPIIVTGVDVDKKINGYFKKKVRYYAEQNGYSTDMAILVKDDITDEWVNDITRVDADTIKAIKLPRNPNGTNGPRVETPYDWFYMDSKGTIVSGSDVTVTGKKIAYISPTDMKETYRKSGTSAGAMLKAMDVTDLTIVVLGTNRIEKFTRSHPNAKHLKTFVQDRINEFAKAASDAEMVSKELDYGTARFFKKVDPTKLDDPALVDLATVVQSSNTANYDKATALQNLAHRASINTTLPARKKAVVDPTKKYPLIRHVGSECIADTILYVNAKFNN